MSTFPVAGTVPIFRRPVAVTGTTNVIRFRVGVTDYSAALPVGTYYWRGDSTAADLVAVIVAALTAALAHGWTATISSTGRITISAAGGAWTLLLTDGLFTFPWRTGGWDLFLGNHASAGVGNSVAGDFQVGGSWYPGVRYLNSTGEIREWQSRIKVGLRISGWTWASFTRQDIQISLLPVGKVYPVAYPDGSAAVEAGYNEDFQSFYDYLVTGGLFEWAPDVTAPGTYLSYQIREPEFATRWPVSEIELLVQRYQLWIPMRRYP